MLEVCDLSMRFGGVFALRDVSFKVLQGETCGLIGPNGAGKTTLFNCISRIYKPTSGNICVQNRSISKLPTHEIASLGVGRTFQNLALFPKLSLLENVMIGAHIHLKTGFAEAALGLGRTKRQETQKRDEAFELLEIVGLSKQAGEPVWSQPFGYQKRVELARALATQPKLLLLDEPAAGLNPSELRGFQELISSVRRRFGLTILLVEHHFGLVMALCERLVALNFGRKIAEGSPEEVRADPEFVRAYLGDKV